VLRGGAFRSYARYARCAYRLAINPDDRYVDLGFRVVASPLVFSDR
jgi:formylglycine-generating enzyme required for sulfatase activity